MKYSTLSFTFIFLLLLAGCDNMDSVTLIKGRVIKAENGMVVSAHEQASEAGTLILAKGGSAIDAAVATGFALAVTYPAAGNIGGGGFMLIRTAEGKYDLIDFREKAPVNASLSMYLDTLNNVIDGLSTNTHLASGVPGSVDGLIRAHEKYGRLPFTEVLEPAIILAEKGFILNEEQAASLNRNADIFRERNPSGTAFTRDEPWKTGDTLIQKDLAGTLKRISESGRDGFYSGITASLIINEMKRGNGIITGEDLEGYSSVHREPLSSKYRDYNIVTVPPPSGGGIILLQVLGMLGNYDLGELGYKSKELVHLIAEAEKRAFADRSRYSGDPDFVKVPVKELLDPSYLRSRIMGISPDSATPSENIRAGSITGYESQETTHYSVVDRKGNAVAVTTTLNGSYGNSIVVNGAGFLLNNEMDDFSVKPGFPNMYGLTGSLANSIEPQKRMLSSMTPVIVEKDGKLFLVAGSPGGSTIPTTVLQVILNCIDFRMDLRTAVDTGRFHHQWLPDRISYEKGYFGEDLLKALGDLGHETAPVAALGRVNAIMVTGDGIIHGTADRRGVNSACGY